MGCCLFSHFEGEAALALEALATQSPKATVRYTIPLIQDQGLWVMDWREMVRQILEDKIRDVPLSDIALAFHIALAESTVLLARVVRAERVVLTGGVMQNTLLADTIIVRLREAGCTPFWHHHIPPNDGGIAVGQIGGILCEMSGNNVCV